MFLYPLAIFWSAFLLFQVQPLLARSILPWFGGSAAVWITCLLFFQVVLLLGYVYAHGLIRLVPASRQAWMHGILLAASLALLPIVPNARWKLAASDDPTWSIVGLLAATVGLPYLLLSSTTPLLQAWYARAQQLSPYRFFAVSNAGSLLGLLAYPLVIEPLLAVRRQQAAWSAAYAVACVLLLAVTLRHRGSASSVEQRAQSPSPNTRARVLWVALAACGSALLYGVTAHLTQNVAAMPLLWVLPLALYLLSFVLCFGKRSWYRRQPWLGLLAVALGGMAYALGPQFVNASLYLLIPLYSAGLLICCVACHGELARLKPHPDHLTGFYLLVSVGGALGGLYASLLAPRIYAGLFELPVALGSCGVLMLVALRSDPGSRFYRASWQLQWLALCALVALLIGNLYLNVRQAGRGARVMARNFYGSLRVVDLRGPRVVWEGKDETQVSPDERAARKLVHGTIDHGLQFLAAGRRREPIGYYAPDSGVGLALRAAERRGPLRVGIIGLGTGTLAAYSRPGDHYRFYEINPLVVRLAESEFSYLHDAPAAVEIVPGDARLALERETTQNYDLLVVDAFSGDAIPAHLLTREAFLLYFRHLKPRGVLVAHISNRYLDLAPVVAGLADSLEVPGLLVRMEGDEKARIYRSTWVVLTRDEELLRDPDLQRSARALRRVPGARVWTDDYTNLLAALRSRGP